MPTGRSWACALGSVDPTSMASGSRADWGMPELTARPRLVVITGTPGSGKTTLGTTLSQALQLPFVARDQIRRGLYVSAGLWDATPPDPVPTRRAAPETFLRVLETTASLGVSAIAECTFARDDGQF